MRRIRNLILCLVLAAASAHGVKVRPDEIQALMEAMRQPKVAHSQRAEQDKDDPPPSDV
jgi:hypothetical protein